MATINNEQIFIQDNYQRVELTGQALEDFNAMRAELQAENVTLKAEQDAKAAAKESALTKLQALGLTEDEIKALVGA